MPNLDDLIGPARRTADVLALVGLASRAGDKVRTFSLGMKQRLALAAALLHDPELLILDEPTNGLDPAGIREFRDLFRELGSRGKTVFVSSHLLGEVELMCDEVAIINKGRLITQGAVADIVQRRDGLELRTTDDAAAARVLSAIEWVRGVRPEDGRFVVDVPRERAAEISRALAEHSIYLHELRSGEHTLEDFFLEVTAEEKAGG